VDGRPNENPERPTPFPAKNSELVIVTAAPVFITPGAEIPLATLSSGSTVKYLAGTAPWFQIEFNDSRWGRRVGFIEATKVVDSRTLTPTDLSITQVTRPSSLEPLDLSIRPRSNPLEPMDLSVPPKGPGARQ